MMVELLLLIIHIGQKVEDVYKRQTIDLPIDSVVSLEPLVPQVSRKRKKIVQSLATTTDPFSHIPTSINIDTSKDVGEIPFSSGLSSSGGVTYSIPIVGAPGRNGFQPNISINYNSQGSNDVLGYGWSIGCLLYTSW